LQSGAARPDSSFRLLSDDIPPLDNLARDQGEHGRIFVAQAPEEEISFPEAQLTRESCRILTWNWALMGCGPDSEAMGAD
jgi:hypothetical protein